MNDNINITLSHSSISQAKSELSKYKNKLDVKTRLIVEALLDYGRRYAQEQLEQLGAVYTQNLLSSIDTELIGNVGFIFTEEEYAKYVEYGTGVVGRNNKHPQPPADWIYDVNEHGYEGWWYYNEADGKMHWTQGMVHRPFMYNTAKELKMKKNDIARGVLKE